MTNSPTSNTQHPPPRAEEKNLTAECIKATPTPNRTLRESYYNSQDEMEGKDGDENRSHHENRENHTHEKNPDQTLQGPTGPTDEITTTPEKINNDHLSDPATDNHES